MKVCAIIPAYNENRTIGKAVQEAKKYVDTVLVVDDGSKDSTAEIARQNGARVISHQTNKGIGPTLQTGYDAALSDGFDVIVQLDGDGQHDPKHVVKMLGMMNDYDVVIGSRFLNGSHRKYPLVRRVGISFFTSVVNLLARIKVTDVTSGYRVFRTGVLRQLPPLSQRHWAVEQTLEVGKRGFSIKEISIEMPPRSIGKSQFSLARYVLYPIRMSWTILRVMVLK